MISRFNYLKKKSFFTNSTHRNVGPSQHLYRKEILTRGKQVGKLKTILDKTEYGPGCNHLKFDFMEELLKILYFFGLNLECIFNYHEKNCFSKIRQKSAFSGSKNCKKLEKVTFFNVFFPRKREMTFHILISFFPFHIF